MTDVVRIDPRTAEVVEVIAREDTTQDVDRAGERVAAAARPLDELGRSGRPAMLRAMADQLEAHDDEIVGIADRETGIGPVRLEVPSPRATEWTTRQGCSHSWRGSCPLAAMSARSTGRWSVAMTRWDGRRGPRTGAQRSAAMFIQALCRCKCSTTRARPARCSAALAHGCACR
jgi:hypothetical protein